MGGKEEWQDLVQGGDSCFVEECHSSAAQLYSQALEKWRSVYLEKSLNNEIQYMKQHSMLLTRRANACFYLPGMEGNAEIDIKLALQLDSQNALAFGVLARLWHRQNCRVDAISAAENAMQLAQNDEQKLRFASLLKQIQQGSSVIPNVPIQIESTNDQQTQKNFAEPDLMGTTKQTQKKVSVRYEWFQNTSFVYVEIFAKQVEKERSVVSFEAQKLLVSLALPEDQKYELDIGLMHSINTQLSSVSFSELKVEIELKKLQEGLTWKSLERKGADQLANFVPEPTFPATEVQPQVSKKDVKNWDKILVDADDGGGLDEATGLQQLFQQIYSNADEDTKRAMNKSFVESGGKVLSTDWKDVGARKVEYTEK